MIRLNISIEQQVLVFIDETSNIEKAYAICTASNGAGEQYGSNRTPRGRHIVRAKIGAGCPENTVFVGRRPSGEIYTPELKAEFPARDWILTRILWLSGCEVGYNRLRSVDTMRRYIYIHATPDTVPMGVPVSHGCILMRNAEIIELFERVPVATSVNII
jgi:lipoprotein-anchoring transpeptidase ErfK/SrfK